MPIETVPGHDLQYYLLAYDANCHEREKGLVTRLLAMLAGNPISDVFLISHGWQGDIPAAQDQYTRWITAIVQCEADIERMEQRRPGFRPLIIGLHWPSLPWGDEELRVAFATAAGPGLLERQIDEYAQRIADTPRARESLRIILTAAIDGAAPESVWDAYRVLNEEAGLGEEGIGAAPGNDREQFDREQVVRACPGPGVANNAFRENMPLTLLRTLSFWKMKARAQQFGESVGINLLTKLQAAAVGRDVRFHLMGHSFGCIVASAMLNNTAIQSVHSLALLQETLSLWSYCAEIPYVRGRPGYFHGVAANNRVSGPMITTQSEHDTAVGRWYPLAAEAGRQVCYVAAGGPSFPKYGAVGAFGIQGDGLNLMSGDLLGTNGSYGFRPGTIYNINASQFIREGSGFSGAHSDICHPEVAHAIWEAAQA